MLNPALIKEFKNIVGAENVFTDDADLLTYSYDAAVVKPVVPALVIRPTTSEALGRSVKVCGENGLPVTVRGAGTNLSGGTVPTAREGVVILTNGLKRILEINEADMYAVVQPGVVTAQFAAAAQAKGLFYPPDPGSQAVSTLGGNVAENAGGLRGLKYGVTSDYVMGLKFFDTNGEIVKTGAKTVKCATGYNLTGLLVGSEGTLGVFDEITLKLIPLPAHRKAMMAVFNQIIKASEAVAAIIAARIIPCTLEFMDNFTIRAVESYSRAGLPTDAAALLLIEVDGHPAMVEEDAVKVEEICRQQGAVDIRVAKDDAERDKVWAARRSALSALAKLKPTLVLEDATVPRSRIPEMVQAMQDIAAKYRLEIGTFGHAGDGNLHPTILTDKRNTEEWERVEAAIAAIFDKALAMGGTLSGEHGTGIAKSCFLEKETSPATIQYSRAVKAALDPRNILNPGKIIGG
ncbi:MULTISPECIES: FAD-binding oxidoreductase [Desulfococcus]|jgi:glycolate oxidase|uniref:FAD linked oxidase domain protein n=1 Tax=Desulfococcus multivorans DSM 2059 TaxID=1121405 RepID=S7U1X7_DESML|nr:FAD-linked oxidase C-terminal domain-containing protein [Desulfococcus multivorans]AOY58523.1 LdhA: lactate dehydrogenase, subunit alpha [Desulfococcus multivorans]AQV00836.1 FAD-binding oxidoreductase [Desulfococcus multivorans]EPR43307.1 FAD linked oxidase domain protein [Desulfococcus multivorans DSM 2059]MDX9819195.1 FAD-linked oxidase C-terminal domain-containing protein [Desulfococcus multivorans]SJZ42445.1 glycolate oxidase [Desulfococcus multivorans DSM 2059]